MITGGRRPTIHPLDSSGLPAALHASGPDPANAGDLTFFGRLVGSWQLDWYGTDEQGEAATATGELHVGWVLGGRAVQDTWIVPGPGRPGYGRPPLAFHGTTVRFYDPAIDAWRSTWIEPLNARVRRFIGRLVGDDIVLLSDEDEPQLRWRIGDVRPDSFVWSAETSYDGGATWIADEKMVATRTR